MPLPRVPSVWQTESQWSNRYSHTWCLGDNPAAHNACSVLCSTPQQCLLSTTFSRKGVMRDVGIMTANSITPVTFMAAYMCIRFVWILTFLDRADYNTMFSACPLQTAKATERTSTAYTATNSLLPHCQQVQLAQGVVQTQRTCGEHLENICRPATIQLILIFFPNEQRAQDCWHVGNGQAGRHAGNFPSEQKIT